MSRATAALLSLLVFACSQAPRPDEPTNKVDKVPARQTIDEVGNLGPGTDAIIVGLEGNQVSLANLWSEHNLTIVFYRAHW